jgi:hypothetical protein
MQCNLRNKYLRPLKSPKKFRNAFHKCQDLKIGYHTVCVPLVCEALTKDFVILLSLQVTPTTLYGDFFCIFLPIQPSMFIPTTDVVGEWCNGSLHHLASTG